MISHVSEIFMSLFVVRVVSYAVGIVFGALFRFVESTVKTEEREMWKCGGNSECEANQGICKTIMTRFLFLTERDHCSTLALCAVNHFTCTWVSVTPCCWCGFIRSGAGTWSSVYFC